MERNYVEIGGVKWATMNVGAEKETDFGLYFQYGSKQGYMHLTNLCEFNKEPTEFYDSVRVYWGDKWRMPTKEEFESLFNSTIYRWVRDYKDSGVNGMLFIDKTDISKKLFFPACGNCGYGSVNAVGYYGYYWSRSLDSNYMNYAWCLDFSVGYARMVNGYHCYGFGVRGVLEDK